jgi:hypothetical protein
VYCKNVDFIFIWIYMIHINYRRRKDEDDQANKRRRRRRGVRGGQGGLERDERVGGLQRRPRGAI